MTNARIERAMTRAALMAETAERAARWRAALVVADTIVGPDADGDRRAELLHVAAAAIYYGRDYLLPGAR